MFDPAYLPRVPARLEEVFYPNGRRAGESRVIDCPYCGQTHSHGNVLGSRSAHCAPHLLVRGNHKPNDAYGNPGYTLCEPADEIDWEAERIHAQLVVLRNRHRRLSAEYPRMPDWSARERRERRAVREEIGRLSTLLNRVGAL